MKLTMIQTSQNRREEIIRFIESLNNQIEISFSQIQYIFLDQGDLKDLFDKLNTEVQFLYLKTNKCSLSKARNIGLKYATGDYICFPDDDCWYAKDVLKNVVNTISNGYNGVIGKAVDENMQITNFSPNKSRLITKFNHYGAISYTIFLKRIDGLYFDENIGVGSPYNLSSGEETDYLIRSFNELGGNILYNSNIIIQHPTNKNGNFESYKQKVYEYSRGNGYLLKKHDYPLIIKLNSLLVPVLRMLKTIVMFDIEKLKLIYSTLRGCIEGYCFCSKLFKSNDIFLDK